MTTTMTADTFTVTSTPHGNLNYFITFTSAAAQAVVDTSFFATQLAGQPPTSDVAAGTFGKIANFVAGLTDAGANVASAGVAIAALVKDEDGNGPMDAIELELVNNTSQSLIVAQCTTTGCRATDIVQTLLPCATDLVLMTASGKRFDANTNFGLGLVIGGGSPSSSIEVGVKFSYVDVGNPGRWTVDMDIDKTSQTFPQELQLLGAQFLGNTGYPSFSMYVSPIETTSGKMTLTFVDTPTS